MQKIVSQMKGQDEIPEKQLNEMEIGNLQEKFKIMILKIIQDLGERMEKMQEIFTKDPKKLKNKDEQYTRRKQKQNN